MRNCKIDNRKVVALKASLIGDSTLTVNVGSCFTYSDDGSGKTNIARSLGRIAWADDDGADVTGFVVAMVLSQDGTFAFERWVNPADIMRVFEPPAKLAAFFFSQTLPYSPERIRQLMAYGTVSESYVDKAQHHVEAWDAGKSPAVYKTGEAK